MGIISFLRLDSKPDEVSIQVKFNKSRQQEFKTIIDLFNCPKDDIFEKLTCDYQAGNSLLLLLIALVLTLILLIIVILKSSHFARSFAANFEALVELYLTR